MTKIARKKRVGKNLGSLIRSCDHREQLLVLIRRKEMKFSYQRKKYPLLVFCLTYTNYLMVTRNLTQQSRTPTKTLQTGRLADRWTYTKSHRSHRSLRQLTAGPPGPACPLDPGAPISGWTTGAADFLGVLRSRYPEKSSGHSRGRRRGNTIFSSSNESERWQWGKRRVLGWGFWEWRMRMEILQDGKRKGGVEKGLAQ